MTKKYLPDLTKTSYMVFHKILKVISKNKFGARARGVINLIFVNCDVLENV
jgi:hypothetical protein